MGGDGRVVVLTETRGPEFFNAMEQAIPSFGPFRTAAYSDTGFQVLAYALVGIKGMEDGVLTPLGLNHNCYQLGPTSVRLLPGSTRDSSWAYQFGGSSS